MAQPHRGPRQFIGVRVPPAVADAIDETWRSAGYRSMSDYVAVLLAEHHGIDFRVRMQQTSDEELPLQSAS